jgi:(S)-2-hydroxyglutarate dehydrogenase
MLRSTFLVAGGGCVGLATAYQLQKKHLGSHVVVLEKEQKVATHQTGRNSGVIHSGIYYKPGTLKAENCRKGKEALEQFCYNNDVPFDRCGKLIVATNKEEEERLPGLLERGKANGVDCRLIGKQEIIKIEPYVTDCNAAIHIPETGIINYREVCNRLVRLIEEQGGIVIRGEKVVGIEVGENQTTVVCEDDMRYVTDCFINCGGLHADKLAKLAGFQTDVQIVPFKGEYYTLTPAARSLCNGLIYPVPDPRFPFLGVHFTRMIDGGVEVGPNAVLAFAREGYGKMEFNLSDTWEMLKFSGFRNIILKHWKMGGEEMMRSLSKTLYLKCLQKMVPSVMFKHLVDDRAPGIRAQVVKPDGTMVDDFLIEKQGTAIHVLNAPSPAATACLTIGAHVASLVE